MPDPEGFMAKTSLTENYNLRVAYAFFGVQRPC